MIFNLTVLKKLMKTAYTGSGLLVANKHGRIIIGGEHWTLAMYDSVFTKKAKSALVELTGDLPAQGESWSCTSAGNQITMPSWASIDEKIQNIEDGEYFRKTVVLYEASGSLQRIYQKNKEIIYVNVVAESLMDGKPEEEEEEYIDGPYLHEGRLYWKNSYCAFGVDYKPPEEYIESVASRAQVAFTEQLQEYGIKIDTAIR